MEFIRHKLGTLSHGDVVVVALRGTEANVHLVDDVQYERYRRGEPFDHWSGGGHFRESPVRFVIPHTASWNVVVDLGGFAGQVGSTVRVFKAAA